MKSNDFVLIMERQMHVLFLWLTVYFLFFFPWTSLLCMYVSFGSTMSFLGKVALW